MKNILITVLSLFAFGALAQETGENGRPVGSKPTRAIQSIELGSLNKNASSTSTNLIVDYKLPSGVNSGKIVLQHPKKDEELKTYNLTSSSGSITVDLKELNLSGVVVGLYDDKGKFVKDFNLN